MDQTSRKFLQLTRHFCTLICRNLNMFIKKYQGVFVKHYGMPPAATKSKKLFLASKVKVKVTRSLTLVSFERVSLVEYACQI